MGGFCGRLTITGYWRKSRCFPLLWGPIGELLPCHTDCEGYKLCSVVRACSLAFLKRAAAVIMYGKPEGLGQHAGGGRRSARVGGGEVLPRGGSPLPRPTWSALS